MFSDSDEQQLKFDTDDLYRVEVFTDQKSGSIRRMSPVDGQGNPDPARAVRYIGEASAMTPAGALPLSFELEGETLAEAAQGFAHGAEQALTETIEELKRLHREQQSSIMVPGQGAGTMGGNSGGFPPGGGSPFKR
ncbi:MAG: hypothetical protein CVV18_01405 [Gammaproteobacteria bacterium HGW-Gammaproteobacteria-8]|nr:MAG: hypothetical protein CVV18_01405 [Gammaproteobacteria bacterium HGW-Gammaproteobacteria-8]